MVASKDIYPENFLRLASLEQIVARRPMELDDLQSGCGISQYMIWPRAFSRLWWAACDVCQSGKIPSQNDTKTL